MAIVVGVGLGPERSHAVVVRGRQVLASLSVTGPDPTALLATAMAACPDPPAGIVIDISQLLQARMRHDHTSLLPVIVIRVVPRAATDPALGRHPDDVIERLIVRRHTVPGGHDLFGHELRPLDRDALRAACAALPSPDIAVVATGSPAQPRARSPTPCRPRCRKPGSPSHTSSAARA
jgi:hypothetical protein